MNDKIDFISQVGLIDVLDSALIDANNSFYGGVREFNPIRPSSSGKCERALAYEYDEYHNKKLATVEEREPNVIRLLSIGHYIESSIINHFRKLKDVFDIHVKYKDQRVTVCKLKDGTLVEGEVDYAIEGKNFKILCDAKSSKTKFSSHYKDSWDETLAKWARNEHVRKISETCYIVEDTYEFVQSLKDDFKTDNIKQLNMYLGSDWFQERDYEWASLHYYLKNTSHMYELRFKFCPRLQAEVTAKFQSVYDNGKTNPTKAKKTFWFGSIRCAWCPFKDRCWSETEDPKYAYFKTLPKKTWPKDLDRLDNGDELEKMFEDYENCLTESEEASNIELAIAKNLYDQKINKVKTSTGNVWEVKLLKSKGLVLRRSKM